VEEESNDYFAARYWALKKVAIVRYLFSFLGFEKVTIISPHVTGS
jgi:hypothetical protein